MSATGGTQSGYRRLHQSTRGRRSTRRRQSTRIGDVDGGDVDLIAGDDITIEQPIDASGNNGGAGGSISARAGADVLGGVKPWARCK